MHQSNKIHSFDSLTHFQSEIIFDDCFDSDLKWIVSHLNCISFDIPSLLTTIVPTTPLCDDILFNVSSTSCDCNGKQYYWNMKTKSNATNIEMSIDIGFTILSWILDKLIGFVGVFRCKIWLATVFSQSDLTYTNDVLSQQLNDIFPQTTHIELSIHIPIWWINRCAMAWSWLRSAPTHLCLSSKCERFNAKMHAKRSNRKWNKMFQLENELNWFSMKKIALIKFYCNPFKYIQNVRPVWKLNFDLSI